MGRCLIPVGTLGRVVIPLALAVLMTAACGDGGPYLPAGIVRTPAPNVSDIVMPDVAHGTEIQFVARPDGLLLVYFGYTSCPDVCPTTMADLRTALRNIGDMAESVDVAMITVDPERDRPEVITNYVHAFFDDGIAIQTLDSELLAEAAEPFGAQYRVTILEDGWVDVVHSAFVYVVDDQGDLRLTWPFGIEPEMIEADIRALLSGELEDV